MMKRLLIASVFCIVYAASGYAGDLEPVKAAPRDKCPVCGMFVAKYPDFIAEIIFKDKSYAVFDGAKDLFKYYFDLSKYSPGKSFADIDSIYVTDYYGLKMIDGVKAYYVIGSDVYGPMGRELIPFEKEGDAAEFAVDHLGKSTVDFKSITHDLVKSLD